MRTIIVDDESFCADYLEELCLELPGVELQGKFCNALDALAFMRDHLVELVLMDVEMPGLNGFEAIKKMREHHPGIAIVFVTSFENYAMEAFRADAVSYLLKPCDAQELVHAIEKAGKLFTPNVIPVRVQTFGMFAVFIKGEPYRFANAKSKELLALLIDRKGSVLSMEQAVEALWENRPYDQAVKQLYRKAVISLNQLNTLAGEEFFVSNRGSCHIVPKLLDCDYYRLLDGDAVMQKRYFGEYMIQYSWAEETNANLFRLTGQER